MLRSERTLFRVRYPETDRMGVAHHTHYLVWFELGRTELMRSAGAAYGALEEEGLFFPVVEAGARYLRPANYDDELEVGTVLSELTAATVRFDYRVRRPADDELLATGHTIHAAVGREGRARRIPPSVRARLEAP